MSLNQAFFSEKATASKQFLSLFIVLTIVRYDGRCVLYMLHSCVVFERDQRRYFSKTHLEQHSVMPKKECTFDTVCARLLPPPVYMCVVDWFKFINLNSSLRGHATFLRIMCCSYWLIDCCWSIGCGAGRMIVLFCFNYKLNDQWLRCVSDFSPVLFPYFCVNFKIILFL